MLKLFGFITGRISMTSSSVSLIPLSIGLPSLNNNNNDDADGFNVEHMFDIQFDQVNSIDINLQNGGVSKTSISTKMTNFQSLKIANLCNRVFSYDDSNVDLLINIRNFKTGLSFLDHYKFFNFNSVQINDLNVMIQVPKTKLVWLLMKDIEIGEFTIDTNTDPQDGSEMVEVDTSLQLHEDSVLKFIESPLISAIDWEIALPGCKENNNNKTSSLELNYINFANLTTGQFEMKPRELNSMGVHVETSEIDSRLSEVCPIGDGKGKSPVDNFVSRLLNNETVFFQLSGSAHQQQHEEQSTKLPAWLRDIIKELKLQMYIPEISDKNKLPTILQPTISKFEIQDIEFEVNKEGHLTIGTEIWVGIELPEQIKNLPDFKVNSIWGQIKLVDHNTTLGYLQLSPFSKVNFDSRGKNITVSVTDSMVVIKDDVQSGELLQKLIQGQNITFEVISGLGLTINSKILKKWHKNYKSNCNPCHWFIQVQWILTC
ncbi:unnamed protein product [Ambrosiozyma monospora]|uniref:Unnamed protein product n=1 Tax=Ambrosiozyma monospora TaxID=43982 RepID=A0ACB5T4Y1_AMBMO|nr:unnamed protein product [Ambrosiozyma monospora]